MIKKADFITTDRYNGSIKDGSTPGYVIAMQVDLPNNFKGKCIQTGPGSSIHFDSSRPCNRPDIFSIIALVKMQPLSSFIIKDIPECSKELGSFTIYDKGSVPCIEEGG
jgi:hypothetical protein